MSGTNVHKFLYLPFNPRQYRQLRFESTRFAYTLTRLTQLKFSYTESKFLYTVREISYTVRDLHGSLFARFQMTSTRWITLPSCLYEHHDCQWRFRFNSFSHLFQMFKQYSLHAFVVPLRFTFVSTTLQLFTTSPLNHNNSITNPRQSFRPIKMRIGWEQCDSKIKTAIFHFTLNLNGSFA